MLFPRLLAVAERGWTAGAWELPYEAGRRFKLGETAHTDRAALRAG
jgi:hexosaminidase